MRTLHAPNLQLTGNARISVPHAPDLLDTAPIHQESLGWLWLNIDRCLGRQIRDQTDRQLAQRLAPQLLRSFAAEVATIDRWAGRLLEPPGRSG